jgi:hypothetical protein
MQRLVCILLPLPDSGAQPEGGVHIVAVMQTVGSHCVGSA